MIALVMTLVAVLPAPAQPLSGQQKLTIDSDQSTIRFTLKATLHKVHGNVPISSGSVLFDPNDGTVTGEIVFDARGADTGNERRDRDMHEKVLESERFPQFVFQAERLQGQLSASEPSEATLHGKLSIHGSVHPVAIPLSIRFEGNLVRASGELTVPYVAWGMKDPSKFLLRVADEVQVRIEIVASMQPIDAAAAVTSEDHAGEESRDTSQQND